MSERPNTRWTFDALPVHRSTSVLLPSTTLTYHFVDPVSQALVRRALNADGFLGIAYVGEDAELDGTEPLPATITLAEINEVVRPSHARLVVAMTGVARLAPDSLQTLRTEDRLGREWTLPVVSGDVRREHRHRADGLDALANDALAALDRLAGADVPLAAALRDKAAELDAPGALPDVLGAVAFDSPDDHQALLEETDVLRRLRRVESQLAELVAGLDD